MQFALSEEDRTRLGAPEVIDYDQLSLSVEDAEAIDEAGGDWRRWGTTQAGAFRAAIWLALRKAGSGISYTDVTFDIRALRVVQAPGKAPSARSGSRTPSTSATSPTGRSSRKTS